MSWVGVARFDLRNSVRSRLLQATAIIFVLAVLVLAVGLSIVGEGVTVESAITHIISLMEWFVPAIGFLIGYGAIVKEKESRTIQHLVTAPHSRLDIIIGKLVSRCSIVAITIISVFIVTGIVLTVLYPGFSEHLIGYVLFIIVTLLFAVSVVGVAVGISALSSSAVRAVSASIGAFIALVFLWDLVPASVYFVVHGSFPGSQLPPDWYFFIQRLNPIEAYVEILTYVFVFLDTDLFYDPSLYLSSYMMLAILVAWLIVPISIGYLRFREMDIK